MIIEFKVKEFEKYMCMYQSIWHERGGGTAVLNDNNEMEIGPYRIVVPEAGISLRSGVVYGKYNDKWQADYETLVVYEQDEKDWNKWICTQGADLEWAIKGYLEETKKIKDIDVSEYDCSVDTSEFMEDEAEAEEIAASDIEYYNKYWKEEFEGEDDDFEPLMK